MMLRLGVNIDHVATLRNARGGDYPDPLRAARIAVAAGADSITAHLREDRRHIRDEDMLALKKELKVPLNFEMAATDEMLRLALKIKPHACCLVSEKREERTTEGGLDVAGNDNFLRDYVLKLKQAGIRVSMFIEPDMGQVAASKNTGAPVVELHAGAYCHALETNDRGKAKAELERLQKAAFEAAKLGLEVHAGHGITYKSVGALAAIPEIVELNIGHFIIGEAVFVGLENAVRNMRALMSQARNPKIMSA
jgi:pyridoxine 5-phosphate synthase